MWDNNAWIFFYDNSTEGEPPFLIQDFIHAFQPNAKLIIMLRDPVERWAKTALHKHARTFSYYNNLIQSCSGTQIDARVVFGQILFFFILKMVGAALIKLPNATLASRTDRYLGVYPLSSWLVCKGRALLFQSMSCFFKVFHSFSHKCPSFHLHFTLSLAFVWDF